MDAQIKPRAGMYNACPFFSPPYIRIDMPFTHEINNNTPPELALRTRKIFSHTYYIQARLLIFRYSIYKRAFFCSGCCVCRNPCASENRVSLFFLFSLSSSQLIFPLSVLSAPRAPPFRIHMRILSPPTRRGGTS